jgi:hypothetical protein
MELKKLFCEIRSIVKTSENYVPRDYKTIGGMWTVDTYKKSNVMFQIMDEGYTTRIITDEVEVICNYNNDIEIKKGTIEILEEILKHLGGN